jgi:hypothetical protein
MTTSSRPPVLRTAASSRQLDPQLDAIRGHVAMLRPDGGTYRGIATAAGLVPATVHDLVSGRSRITVGTATALRAVTAEAVPRARVDAGGSRLRLRALHVMGTAPPASPAPSARATRPSASSSAATP